MSSPCMALCSAPLRFICRLFFETIQKLRLTLSVSVFSLPAVLAPSQLSSPFSYSSSALLSPSDALGSGVALGMEAITTG